jgi:hypothetical protein
VKLNYLLAKCNNKNLILIELDAELSNIFTNKNIELQMQEIQS